MNPKKIKQKRLRRHRRVRARIRGTADRPRLSVFCSNRHLVVQLIDDVIGRTIAAASDRDIARGRRGGRMPVAALLGAAIARIAQEHNIAKVVFDRGGRRYHGIVRAIADAARTGGIDF